MELIFEVGIYSLRGPFEGVLSKNKVICLLIVKSCGNPGDRRDS